MRNNHLLLRNRHFMLLALCHAVWLGGCPWLVGRVCCWDSIFITKKLLSSGRPHIESLLQPYTRMLPVLGGYIYIFSITLQVWVFLKNIQNQRTTGSGYYLKNQNQRTACSGSLQNLKGLVVFLGGFFKKVENHGYTSELGMWFFYHHGYTSKPSIWFDFFENHRYQN